MILCTGILAAVVYVACEYAKRRLP